MRCYFIINSIFVVILYHGIISLSRLGNPEVITQPGSNCHKRVHLYEVPKYNLILMSVDKKMVNTSDFFFFF